MRRFLVGGVVLVASLALPGLASAAPAACSTPPPAYTGSDATVAAVTQLTIDQDQNCKAIADRVDAVDGDVTSSAAAAHTDAGAVKTAVDQVHTDLGNPLSVTFPTTGTGNAVQVTNWPGVQTVGLDSTSSAQFDGQAQSEHGDLWVLIGVIVGTFAFGQFLRKAWP